MSNLTKNEEKRLKSFGHKRTGFDFTYRSRMGDEHFRALRRIYTDNGWTPVRGSFSFGFVSPCGEFFNSFCVETGNFYSFSTEWAKRVTNGFSKTRQTAIQDRSECCK